MRNLKKENLETVLVLAPTLNDSVVACDVLRESGLEAYPCKDLDELCQNLCKDFGAVLVAEEVIKIADIPKFQDCVAQQKPWSDIPIMLMTNNDVIRVTELFSKGGNISLLERPFSKLTLIRSVEVALRARRKQYEVRELLAALKNSKEAAERANISKTQFLANMSHEIRTPIGAILGFTDLMKNLTNTPEENSKYMVIVERNSQQLLSLIDDILDLSKVEAGKMNIEKINFSLTELLSDFTSIMNFKASEKGITFIFQLETAIPESICSDSVRIRQILTNIVGNALKFTEKGSVSLTISYINSTLKFVVKDTGLGISTEQEKHLFQPFSQADTSTTRKYGGTGLGLILSRRIAENLKGRLDLVESQESLGSTFVIELEVPATTGTKFVLKEAFTNFGSKPEFHQTSHVLYGLKILLVEDSPDNQMLITTYLKKEGAQVTLANNGIEGVEMALTDKYDLLLMDIQMPFLDGHEATRRLRQLNFNKPIIALTAHAMKEEHDRCIASGFNDFLKKPIQRNLLIDTLSKYTSSKYKL
ncbi:MAG: response regulator [Bdellovibrio sp.]|nr:response regulator [Bdellovibrio sp.]